MLVALQPHDLLLENVLNYFVQLYIDACNELMPGYTANPENTLKVIVKKVKLFWAYSSNLPKVLYQLLNLTKLKI